MEIHSEAAERRRAGHTASLWSPANSDKLGPETLLLVIGDFPWSRMPPSWPDKDVHLLRPAAEKQSPAHQTFNVFYISGFISRLQTWTAIEQSIRLLHSSGPIRSDQPWRQRLRLPIEARGNFAVASHYAPKCLAGLLAKASSE